MSEVPLYMIGTESPPSAGVPHAPRSAGVRADHSRRPPPPSRPPEPPAAALRASGRAPRLSRPGLPPPTRDPRSGSVPASVLVIETNRRGPDISFGGTGRDHSSHPTRDCIPRSVLQVL